MSEPPARDVALNNLQLQQMLDAFRFSLEQTLANGQNLQLPATDQPPEPPTPDEPVDQPADPPSGRTLGKYAAMAREPAPAPGPSVPRVVPKPPAKNTKRGQQLRKTMEKTYRGDEELAKSAYDDLMRDLSEAVYVGNPFTMQHHQDAYTAHVDICVAHGLCKEDQCWDIDIIRKHAEFSLVYRMKHARGPKGPIQSRTALSWLTHFVYNICVYTRDPATGKLAGLVVMREGLYNTLEQRTRWAIQEYGLLRHPKKQVRLDMAAIQLIIEQVLTSSKSGLKRSPGLQTVNGLLLGFYGAFRSGSLISSHKDHQEKDMFLKVGDCDLPVEKPGRFKLVVKIDNWKGYNGSVGESMTFTFDPVNKAHNVNFDLPLSVAVDFMSRGFFVGITSVEELFDFAGSHLPIDPKYKKYPVFTARTARGLDIIEGKPIRIKGLTASISYHGAQAGIAGATIHAIRRGTADYGVGLGKDRSMLIMNHGQRLGKIFDNYTSGVETIPLVGVRLEEFSGSLTPLERKIMSNVKLISPAIDCIIRRSQATGGPLGAGAKNWQAITPEEEEQLKADPNIGPLMTEHQAAWLNYASLFPNVHAPYSKECRRQVPKLKNHITPTTSQQAAIRLQTFDDLNDRLTSARRKGLLKIRKSTKKEALNTRPNATAAERAAAREEMDKESVLFDEAKAMYQAEASPSNITMKYLKAKATRLTLTPAQATALQLPEPVRVKLASLPEATEDTQADSDDDDEETEMVAEALPGKGTSKDQVPDFQLKFLPLHNSKRAGPNPKETETEETEIEEDIPTTLGDKDQPDVFGIDVDVFRMIYARYLYGPIEQAKNRALAKRSDKHFVCLKCPSFLSRVEKLTKQLEKKGKDTSEIEFTFSTEINYNRHMRVQHCAWMELELEMQQEDSDMLICPGCQDEFASIATAHKHCRTDCPKKDEFIPLFNDYQTAKPRDNPLVVQEQADRRREKKWDNKDVPITKAGLEIVRKLKNDLEAYPGAFEEWFKSVPKAETLGMSMTELQDEYIEIILVALQTIKETGEEEAFYTEALKPTAMTELFIDSYEKLKRLREDHPSDYDESTDEEVDKDGEANE